MEYFIEANSFAAPFFSDTSSGFVEADSPEQALLRFKDDYKHPCGLYAAVCYQDANAKHKGHEPLAKWVSNAAGVCEGKPEEGRVIVLLDENN